MWPALLGVFVIIAIAMFTNVFNTGTQSTDLLKVSLGEVNNGVALYQNANDSFRDAQVEIE